MTCAFAGGKKLDHLNIFQGQVLRVTDDTASNIFSLTYGENSTSLRKCEKEVDILNEDQHHRDLEDDDLKEGNFVLLRNVHCVEKEISTPEIELKAFGFFLRRDFSVSILPESHFAALKLRDSIGFASPNKSQTMSQSPAVASNLFNQSQPLTESQNNESQQRPNLDDLYTPAELIQQLCEPLTLTAASSEEFFSGINLTASQKIQTPTPDDGNRVVLAGLGHNDNESRNLEDEDEQQQHQPLTSTRRLRSQTQHANNTSTPKVNQKKSGRKRKRKPNHPSETERVARKHFRIYNANDDELDVTSRSSDEESSVAMREVNGEMFATCPEEANSGSQYGTCPEQQFEETEEDNLIVIQ